MKRVYEHCGDASEIPTLSPGLKPPASLAGFLISIKDTTVPYKGHTQNAHKKWKTGENSGDMCIKDRNGINSVLKKRLKI